MSTAMDRTQTITSKAKAGEEPVIEIRNLKKSFGEQVVLSDISFDLLNGENLVVLGKSGTGKTILIKCIIKLLDADSGVIKVLGKDITGMDKKELDDLRPQMGFLFQSGALYDSMTVKENIEFPLRRIKRHFNEKEISNRVEEVLDNVGLKDALHKIPSQLSGGMRKRISLARTIAVNPAIMLYDEPTTGLDPVTSNEISELINEVRERYKTSSIIITHDMKCVRHTADRIIMLDEGKIYFEGKLADFENSKDPFIHSFFT
jgi:phospholipid/cholesterol/gamma-HCH transport system ATP-binding protein